MVYVSTYIGVCVSVHVDVGVARVCECGRVYIHGCMHVYLTVRACVCVCVRACVRACVCVCVCVCLCVCVICV